MVIDADGACGTDPRERGGRSQNVTVALRPQEWSAWRQAATLAGRPQLAAWVRDVVAAHLAGRELPDPGQVDALEALAGELGREGSNLNQAAKALNSLVAGGQVSPETGRRALEAVEAASSAVTATLRKTWQALDEVEP
jgi:hypothetical protein